MSEKTIILLLLVLYGMIDGFIVLFLPYYIISNFGYSFLRIYSIILLIPIVFCLTFNVLKFRMKYLISLAFGFVLIYSLLLLMLNFESLIIIMILYATADTLIFMSSKTYIVRLSKDIKTDLSKWSIFATLGYIFAGIWPILIVKSIDLVIKIVIILSITSFILSIKLKNDKKESSKYKSYTSMIENEIKVLPGYLFILIVFYIFFMSLPAVFRLINIPTIIISSTFILLNMGVVIGDLILIKEKYNELKKFLILVLIILILISPVFITLVINKNIFIIFLIFVMSVLMEVVLNNLFVIETKYLKKEVKPTQISIVSSVGEEFSYVLAPLILSFGYVTALFIVPFLFILELIYVLIYIYKYRSISQLMD